MLNVLFDAQAKAIAGHGGEILKFIGDRPACDFSSAREPVEDCLDGVVFRRIGHDQSLSAARKFTRHIVSFKLNYHSLHGIWNRVNAMEFRGSKIVARVAIHQPA